ncbi:putative glutamine-dependent NAD+ synthetase [Myxococcus stipitatus DSM 14675]|uniref:Glutamine-dependent NAD(+) synthetase n=1 Tax=Myxococcus stipitatus (strain DSM 14675 / JCM 12634 / Mx s8) TaxID=1278073 RepID=L7UL19_MYXSD|nr:NAD(+) synthase [Myxococcus stipitatus]AGC48713.1 putative glutamine-dependent NAD+ synthetase [Myxococcus stipitatus DSM 14675]
MRLVKVGIASVNTTVGAFVRNVDRALVLAKRMAEDGVTVGVFQEQLLAGYPAEDMVQWQGFIDRQWPELERFAQETAALPTVFIVGVGVALQGQRLNCAAVVAGGRVLGLVPKEKLPTYNVFYEARTFGRGQPGMAEVHRGVPLGDYLFQFDFGVLAPEVCEDIWSADGPMRRRAYSGAELVVNISASPFRLGVVDTRRELIATRASDHQCTIAYANAVGANDGLIFDGGGYLNQNGRQLLEAPRFREGYAAGVVDLDRTLRLRGEATTWRLDREAWVASAGKGPSVLDCTQVVRTRRDTLAYPVPAHRSFFLPAQSQQRSAREALCEDILDALALGVGDYFEKTRAFKLLGIALSGGRDSLLTLLIAHRYARRVRPENPGSLIQAFYMPSRYSSDSTRDAAETIARELGVPFQIVSIDEAFERERAVAQQMLGGASVTPITEQNIQARLRAQRMWNWSNSCGGLFLQTGNMSEKSVGYTTIGGDLMGALAVIANVPKTVVVYLLDYLQEVTGYEGIRKVLAKPAGPELAHNQVGEEELMPFPILDACFYLYAGEKLTPAEMLKALVSMFPEVEATRLGGYVDKFVRLFTQSIYKWVQSPLSLHIGNLDLDRERALQLPVVTGSEWMRDKA